MARPVRWQRRAKEDLAAIAAHIAQRNTESARRCVARIRMRVGQLQEFPESGRIVPEYHRNDIRELIVLRWRVIHRVSADVVDVLAVYDAARQLPGDPPPDDENSPA